MFRPIQKRFSKRKEEIVKNITNKTILEASIAGFLESIFGSTSQQITIQAKIEHGDLFIKTNNKIVANEIVFHGKSLYYYLRRKGINYNNLIIQ